jgi:hypothetical protein
MRDMQYRLPKFSAPASHNTDQITWDLAFLSKEEFITKYNATAYFIMTAPQKELDDAWENRTE